MNFDRIKDIVAFQQKPADFYPAFGVGDTIKVYCLINDQKKQRTQVFEGVVLVVKGFLNNRNFLVRKSVGEFSVEKWFFYNSPLISKIENIRLGKVRRAKIYYLRKLRGKAARIKELKKSSFSSRKR